MVPLGTMRLVCHGPLGYTVMVPLGTMRHSETRINSGYLQVHYYNLMVLYYNLENSVNN